MSERQLGQGDAVLVECGRSTAPLGIELADTGVLNGELGRIARVLGPDGRLSDDFSAGSYVLQFLVATASGVSAATLIDLVKAELERRARRKGIKIEIDVLNTSPDDDSIRLRLSLTGELSSVDLEISGEGAPSASGPAEP